MIELLAITALALVATALLVVWRRDAGALTRPLAAAAAPVSAEVVESPDDPTDPVGRAVVFLRRRKWLRRGLSALSVGLIAVAVGMLAYPVYTNWWADRKQGQLERELASPELRQAYLEGRIKEGESLTRLRIPKIDVDVVVVEGVGASALRAGAGHYPASALPCEDGNVGVAGHRTTYGRPFHNLDLLKVGDTIILETPVGSCSYEVTEAPFVVPPDRVEVVNDTPGEANLTLTTCHPKGSARERLIVKAKLVSGNPVGA